MSATNAQVQSFVNERMRPHCELIRNLYLSLKDDQAVIDDVYANVSDNPTWTDTRSDAPPHLITPNNVLAYNAFMVDFIAFIESGDGAGNYPVVVDSCVRAV